MSHDKKNKGLLNILQDDTEKFGHELDEKMFKGLKSIKKKNYFK